MGEDGGEGGHDSEIHPTLVLPPAFAEAPARSTRLWQARLHAGAHQEGEESLNFLSLGCKVPITIHYLLNANMVLLTPGKRNFLPLR